MLTRMMTLLTAICGALILTGCNTAGTNGYSMDDNYNFYGPNSNYRGGAYQSRGVSVPNSYHFANGTSPKKHSQRDVEWINEQNSGAYTIEVASDKNPAAVAKTLQEAPKQARKAQFKHQQNGQTVYTGIYGSYNSREEAEAALSNLPSEVRGNANVESMSKVQRETRQQPRQSYSRPSVGNTPEPAAPKYDALEGLDL